MELVILTIFLPFVVAVGFSMDSLAHFSLLIMWASPLQAGGALVIGYSVFLEPAKGCPGRRLRQLDPDSYVVLTKGGVRCIALLSGRYRLWFIASFFALLVGVAEVAFVSFTTEGFGRLKGWPAWPLVAG